MKFTHEILLGDCRDEALVENLFGSVSEFARLVEEKGDNFTDEKLGIRVEYNAEIDVHYFYARNENF